MTAKSPNQVMRESLQLVPTELEGVYGVEPPPPGFDPLRADQATLLRHGFPLRPDPEQAPAAADAWRMLMARPLRHVLPQLRPRPEVKDAPPGQAGLNSPSWSGGVLLNGGPYYTVNGAWTVPAVTPGASGDGDWWSVAWTGIDGWNSTDVLQAGTAQHASRKNGVVTSEYFAWYEWYPFNWVQITNLAVNPGDTVFVLVRYLGIDSNRIGHGMATLANLTRGTSTSVTFSSPSGTTLQGNCAEWIMERPGFSGVLAALPEYGHITFYNCTAFSATGTPVGGVAQAAQMVDPAGKTMSIATLSSGWDCSFVLAS